MAASKPLNEFNRGVHVWFLDSLDALRVRLNLSTSS